MANQYPELEAAAAKLEGLGDQPGADAVRRAASQLTASGHEIERLLVDIEALNSSLATRRAAQH